MSKKKIEPTDTMVEAGASSAWEEANPGILGWNSISERHKEGCRRDARAVLTAALNHPDAAGLFAGEDDRPWEPLDEGDPARAGDEVRRDHCGIITTGVVARVDEDGDPFTAEGYLIGLRDYGTWYVRRAVQELPTEDGAVIVPSEGREFIGGDGGRYFARLTYSGQLRLWYGVVVNGGPAWAALWYGEPEKITPGTWQVDGEDAAR